MTSPLDRLDARRAGAIMQGTAAAGLVVALIGVIVGWNLVGRLDSAAGDTLDLTIEALTTIDNTIAVGDDIVTSTVDALEAVELTLAELVRTTDATQPLLESLGQLGADTAPNLESVADTLRTLERLGATIDSFLQTLSALPGVPNYDPDTPLSVQFGALADDIEPLAETLRETAEQVGPTMDSTAELRDRVAELEGAVRAVRKDLARSDELLSNYAATVSSARVIADSTSAGLGRDVAAARTLIVMAALTFAVAQIVPYWFGRELRARPLELAGSNDDPE
jgi:ABC-type transporter Mla subunit MlaD